MKEVNCAQPFLPSRPHVCERELWPETLSPPHGRSFSSLCPNRSSSGFLEILDLSFCWPAKPCTPSRPCPSWSTNYSVCELVKAWPQPGDTGKERQKHVPSPWQWAQALPTPGAAPGWVNGAAGRMRYDATSLPWHPSFCETSPVPSMGWEWLLDCAVALDPKSWCCTFLNHHNRVTLPLLGSDWQVT